MENKFCQSCGMPMTVDEQFGCDADVPRMENIVLIAIVTGLLLKIVRWTR